MTHFNNNNNFFQETFNEDDSYSLLQPLEADYAQIDGEDD